MKKYVVSMRNTEVHHMTVKKMKRIQTDMEEKLDLYEKSIKGWLPKGYHIEHSIELGIINEETDDWLNGVPAHTDQYERFRFERAFDWIGVFNSTHKNYQKHLKEMDRLGIY